MDLYWPVFITGTLLMTAGAAIIRHRLDSVSDVAEGQQTMFSRLGEKIAEQSKAAGTLGVGIGVVLFGALGIVLAYVVPPDRWRW